MHDQPEKNEITAKSGGRRTVMLVLILVIAVLAALAAGYALGNRNPDSSLTVQTPVGALTFPAEWAEGVRVEETKDANQVTQTVYGHVGKDEVRLFALVFGPDAQGYAIGSAPDKAGKRQKIWLDIAQIEPDPSWSPEATNRINETQSCVNDLIDQLYSLEGFQAAD